MLAEQIDRHRPKPAAKRQSRSRRRRYSAIERPSDASLRDRAQIPTVTAPMATPTPSETLAERQRHRTPHPARPQSATTIAGDGADAPWQTRPRSERQRHRRQLLRGAPALSPDVFQSRPAPSSLTPTPVRRPRPSPTPATDATCPPGQAIRPVQRRSSLYEQQNRDASYTRCWDHRHPIVSARRLRIAHAGSWDTQGLDVPMVRRLELQNMRGTCNLVLCP